MGIIIFILCRKETEIKKLNDLAKVKQLGKSPQTGLSACTLILSFIYPSEKYLLSTYYMTGGMSLFA